MKLRVAVVGAGFIGQLHARVISESPLAQLAAIVDVDQEAGKRLASNFGVDSYPSVGSICEDPGVDAAIVAGSPTRPRGAADHFLQRGRAVLAGDAGGTERNYDPPLSPGRPRAGSGVVLEAPS